MASAARGIIQLDEGIEGDQICSANYRFLQIGQPVPIETNSTDKPIYDSQNPPSLPLAVSERFRLLFVAHSNGFYVARTKEVMSAAEDLKDKGSGPSIHKLSIMNLSIGTVSLLTLSWQDSILAACVENQIHFFMMSALLNKVEEPSFSVGLDDSGYIQDMKWAGKVEKDYVVLSSTGKLYHGHGGGSLENVSDDVDAVEWRACGKFLAVARKNVLSIMSSNFKEVLRFCLSPSSVKVDTIRWVRADRIVVGSFVLDDDSEEANYLVQVITAEGEDITDTSSKPAVVSFHDMFLDYRFDVVPGAAGPNMFLCYLKNHELAFVANRRNFSQHVVLLGWLSEDQNRGVAVIEVSNDAWCAHIESQGNGDDNFLLALSVDKVSQNEGIKFVLGEKEAEVTPCCIVLCVTVDGKLSLFHFASAASAASSRLDLADADTQVDKHLNVLSEQSRSGIFREVIEPRAVSLTSEDGKSSGNDNDKPEEQGVSTNQAQKSSVSSQMLKSDNEGMFSFTNLEENRGTQESEVAEKLSLKSEYSPFHTSHPEVPGTEARNVGKTIMSAPFEAKLHADSLSEMVLNDASRSVSKSMQTSSVFGFGGGISVSDSSVRRFLLPGDSDGKSASPAYIVPSLQSEKSKLQPAGAISLSPKDMKETSNQSFRMISQGERAATMAESRSTSPSTFDLQVPSREKFVSGKSSMPRLGVENFRTSSHLLQSNHEQKQSSQFSNVEMLVKQMDEILEHIGGDGGFKDASITFQEGSVSALEEGIRLLSDRCRTWRGKLEAQSRDIEHLLDKTVQVLARKVYMEGIFQQATDNWYSDLWNSHKLNLELELKRQHILEIDHELASQLVQLERHFNTIELNKFGESGALQENQKIVESGFGKPRELRTLQDTMLAQLAAAEKLSERLKKQMAALSIECRDSKQNIKREVFETLGLAYDGASYNILCKEKAPDTPRKDLLAKFSSVTAKDHCWKNLSTTTKNSEPKTVRRRRDSLGQMKSSVIPLKTTVKRALLLEDHGSLESRFPTEVKELRPELQLGEEIVHPVHSGPNDVYVRSLFQYEGKASGRTALKKFAQHPSMLSPWTSGPADPGIEVVPARSSPAFVEPPPDTASARQNVAWENHTLSGKYTSNLAFGQTSGNDSRHVQQFPKFPSDGPLVAERNSAVSPVPFKNSIENPIFRNEERGTSGATNRKVEPTTIRSERSLAVSPPISLGKVLDTETSANHLGEKISSATNRVVQSTASTSFPEPSGEIKSHSTSSGHSLSISPAILDEKSLQSHSLFSSVSINSFSSGTPSSGDKGAESQESGSQPLLGVFTSNKDERLVLQTTKTTLLGGETAKAGEASVLQPELSTGSSRFIIASEASTASPATKFPGSLNSESQLNIESASSPPVSEMAPNSMIGRALPSKDDLSASPAAIFTGVSLDGKDATSVNNEDEMEEEAPESNLTTELSLGDLGGLGFGSSSTLTVTKPNPFGVETVGPVSSQFQMPSPQGGMFRPASFNFQSPLPLQPSVASTSTLFSSGFSSGGGNLGHSSGGFGQPAQFGQQSLGSVLGAFGQSRQLGASPPGNSSAPSSGFGGSFTGSPSAGFGFAAATTPGGGFAAAATSGGGFAAAAASGGGFANVANPGGGGGGFAGAATAGGGFAAAATAGGGFGAFSNQFGGNFSAFGSSSGAGRPPSDLFTQMRK